MRGQTLTPQQLAQAQPVEAEGGRALRAFCPFHGSDNQRSLRIDLETGHFKCFACGIWGYTEEARARWPAQRAGSRQKQSQEATPQASRRLPTSKTAVIEPVRPDLNRLLRQYQEALLPNSPGAEYLERRGVSVELARNFRIGYAAPGRWAHPARDWREGRIVAPHTDPEGRVINLYGRAIELRGEAPPKWLRHDHLPAAFGRKSAKGLFNAPALRKEAVFVTEGVFDALSLIAVGANAAAMIGLDGWRWQWVKAATLVLVLDTDNAGREALPRLATDAVIRGREVFYLPPGTLGGCKDINEAFVKGLLGPL
jgi:DNA primase